MKIPIGLAISWTLYAMGHVVSLLLRYDSLAFLYPLYNGLMWRSAAVQDWSGCDGPWVECEPEE